MSKRFVLAAAFSLSLAAPASAQSIQWGMWGEPPERHKSTSPSFLGAPPIKPAALAQGGGRPDIAPKQPKIMAFANGLAPGSIVIDTAGRKLYYTLSQTEAFVYPVAVGKQGFAWTGVETVSRVESWPDWIPPAEMRQRKPGLPLRMAGGVNNPLGAKAIYLGNTLYRIHGTNDASSIGSAASSGCFRMHNSHVVHLASQVTTGTQVIVMSRLPKGPVMPPAVAVKKTPDAPTATEPAQGSDAAPPEAAQPGGDAVPAEPAAQPQPSSEGQPI